MDIEIVSREKNHHPQVRRIYIERTEAFITLLPTFAPYVTDRIECSELSIKLTLAAFRPIADESFPPYFRA